MSLLIDPDPGECVDRPGAPHKLQAGSGMEERGPTHVSVGISSGFKWFRRVADPFREFSQKNALPVFVLLCTYTMLD